MNYSELVQNLRQVPPQLKNQEIITELYKSISYLPFLSHIIRPGETVARMCSRKSGERFSLRSRLGIKPDCLNTEYGRASIPGKSAFYAAYKHPRATDSEVPTARIVALVEVAREFEDEKLITSLPVTFTRWKATKPLNLAVILNYSHGERIQLLDEYEQKLANKITASGYDYNEVKPFYDFLGEEFGKPDITHHEEYIKSAIFANIMFKEKVDGILYSSVRADGKGLNVAIKRSSMKKLSLIAACESTALKNRKSIMVHDDAVWSNASGSIITYKDLPNMYDTILEKMGMKSLDDFSN